MAPTQPPTDPLDRTDRLDRIEPPGPAERLDRPIRVLLVDDDHDDYVLTRDLLAEGVHNRYEVDWMSSYGEALQRICKDEHDVYILDYVLGDKTGLQLLEEARTSNCPGPVILLTGQSNEAVDRAAMEAGAADFLEKSRIDSTLLERSIRYVLQQKRHKAELERKVAERTAELAQANDALKKADLRKDEFLATLAHELRNPLAPIRNALEIMRLGAGNPPTLEKARQIIERQVGQLIRLVDDLLDVSRVTRGKLRLNIESVSLATVMEAAVEMSRPHFDQAKVTLNVTLPANDVLVNGDRIRLAQVFSNLLNNAAKFTDAGGHVALVGLRKGQQAEVHVKDNGVGIAPDLLGRIFDLFTQMDRTVSRSPNGLGIGLAIVRRLVEIHGGTVEARSDGPGKGAEFIVRLPAS
jgi:signal transduction histidine kinase